MTTNDARNHEFSLKPSKLQLIDDARPDSRAGVFLEANVGDMEALGRGSSAIESGPRTEGSLPATCTSGHRAPSSLSPDSRGGVTTDVTGSPRA